MLEFLLERANYWVVIVLMMIGLYITFASQNLIKRMVGLGLFQTTICLFYVTLGKVSGGTAPILFGDDAIEHHGAGHAAEAEAAMPRWTPCSPPGESTQSAWRISPTPIPTRFRMS